MYAPLKLHEMFVKPYLENYEKFVMLNTKALWECKDLNLVNYDLETLSHAAWKESICTNLAKKHQGMTATLVFDMLDETNRNRITMHAISASTVYEWYKYKQAYIINKELQDAFVNTDVKKIKLDSGIKLPFPYVYIDTPDNPFFIGALVGYTRHDNKDFLRISYVQKQSLTKNIALTSNTIEINENFVERMVNISTVLSSSGEELDYSSIDYVNYIPTYGKIIINALLYMASDEPEITIKEKEEIRTYDKATRKTRKSELVKSELATSYVKEIRHQYIVLSQNVDNNHSSAADPRHVRVHWRRGHYHTYLTGEGRKTPVIHWLKPQLVGLNKENKEETALTKRTIA